MHIDGQSESHDPVHKSPLRWRSQRLCWAVAVVLAVPLLAAGIPWKKTRGGLVPESAGLNLGRVQITETFRHEFTVTNTSNVSLEVIDFKTSCDCVHLSPKDFLLTAGASQQITLMLNSTVLLNADPSSHEHPIELLVVPVLKQPLVAPPRWTLTGTGVVPLTLNNNQVVFAGEQSLAEGGHGKRIVVRGSLHASEMRIKARPQFSKDLVEVSYKTPTSTGCPIEIAISPSTDREQGWFSTTVDLTVIDGTGNDIANTAISIEGEVVAGFSFYPQLLELGTFPIGTAVSADIKIDASRGKLIDSSTSSNLITLGTPHRTDGIVRLPLTFVVSSASRQSEAITLIYETFDGAIMTGSVNVAVQGSANLVGDFK